MDEKDDSMPKAEREKQILQFLDQREVMLPPKALYDNLVEFEGITYSDTTVKRLLIDMNGRGLVERVDTGNGYYKVTDRGRAYISGELDEDEATG